MSDDHSIADDIMDALSDADAMDDALIRITDDETLAVIADELSLAFPTYRTVDDLLGAYICDAVCPRHVAIMAYDVLRTIASADTEPTIRALLIVLSDDRTIRYASIVPDGHDTSLGIDPAHEAVVLVRWQPADACRHHGPVHAEDNWLLAQYERMCGDNAVDLLVADESSGRAYSTRHARGLSLMLANPVPQPEPVPLPSEHGCGSQVL